MGSRGLEANPHNSLFQHEYGHYLQSQAFGWGYLSRVGIPSLFDAASDTKHDFHPVEQDANMRAFKYFNRKVPGFYQTESEYLQNKGKRGWNFEENPLVKDYNYWNYNDPNHMKLINNLKISPKFFDYSGWIIPIIGPIGFGIRNYYHYKK